MPPELSSLSGFCGARHRGEKVSVTVIVISRLGGRHCSTQILKITRYRILWTWNHSSDISSVQSKVSKLKQRPSHGDSKGANFSWGFSYFAHFAPCDLPLFQRRRLALSISSFCRLFLLTINGAFVDSLYYCVLKHQTTQTVYGHCKKTRVCPRVKNGRRRPRVCPRDKNGRRRPVQRTNDGLSLSL